MLFQSVASDGIKVPKEPRHRVSDEVIAAPSGEGKKSALCLPRRWCVCVCSFFLEGKVYTFGSGTEIEKLSLTYFLSSEWLALSSRAE